MIRVCLTKRHPRDWGEIMREAGEYVCDVTHNQSSGTERGASDPAFPASSHPRSRAALRISAGGSDAAKTPQVGAQGVTGSNLAVRTAFHNESLLSFGDAILSSENVGRDTHFVFICDLCPPGRREQWPRLTIVQRKFLVNDLSIAAWNRRQLHQGFVIQYLQMQPRLMDVTQPPPAT